MRPHWRMASSIFIILSGGTRWSTGGRALGVILGVGTLAVVVVVVPVGVGIKLEVVVGVGVVGTRMGIGESGSAELIEA